MLQWKTRLTQWAVSPVPIPFTLTSSLWLSKIWKKNSDRSANQCTVLHNIGFPFGDQRNTTVTLPENVSNFNGKLFSEFTITSYLRTFKIGIRNLIRHKTCKCLLGFHVPLSFEMVENVLGTQLLKFNNNSRRDDIGDHYREGGLDMWS